MIGIIIGLVIAIVGSVLTTIATGADPATAFFIGLPWGFVGSLIALEIDGY